MNRRDFLHLSTTAPLAWLAACGSGHEGMGGMSGMGGMGGQHDGNVGIANLPQARRPLPIPALLTGTQFDLVLQSGSSSFLDGKVTPTYGINGDYLGPAIKIRRGDEVTMRVTNLLPMPSTLHWQGMHVPPPMDGGPHQTILPGATWEARFLVRQRAGTNWFHPHLDGDTGRQVYLGLAGLLLVEDEDTDRLDLPRTWGDDDIPLIIQDRRFDAAGGLLYVADMRMAMDTGMCGMLGDTLLANGAVNAEAVLPAKQVRLRLLNGSNARVYSLRFDDGRAFLQIATDGGLLESPLAQNEITLSPGERAEIVVDLSADLGRTLVLLDRRSGGRVLVLAVNLQSASVTTVPALLTSPPRLDLAAATTLRTFSLSMAMGMPPQFYINGRRFDPGRIDHSVSLDAVEIWEIRNDDFMGLHHNFHVHGLHFQLLDRDGSAANVAPYERGLKDTVSVPAGGRVRIILQPTDYTADATAPYMFHCHILEHEDRGMMGQFVVV